MAQNETELAKLIGGGDAESAASEIAPGIYVSPGISNAYLVATDAGNVLVNSGIFFQSQVNQMRFAAFSSAPAKFLIFTQGHADHIGGAAALASADTQIIAQANYPVVRGYWNRLGDFYARRTRVLWSNLIGSRGELPKQPPDPEPDVLFDDRHVFELGGRRFELLATPGGETTDSLVVWLPAERIVFTGNLFGPIFGHLPNLYTIRGDKIRSALRFLESLDRVRELDPELMVTGHGEPIRGRDEIQSELARIRNATQWLHDRTVDGMNAGKDVFALMREIRLPDELAVGQGHGKTSWCVRAIFEEYAGWFHYRSTTELYPVPHESVYSDLVTLAGAEALVRRAREHSDAGRPVEALHLTDIVLSEAPADASALAVRASALATLLERSGGENFSEVQWLRSRLAQTREALGMEDEDQ